jgi:hypothetical protein
MACVLRCDRLGRLVHAGARNFQVNHRRGMVKELATAGEKGYIIEEEEHINTGSRSIHGNGGGWLKENCKIRPGE